MDSTEDLSARVLLKHILNVEQPRTPLTRSATAQSASGRRRSSRLNKNAAGPQTPQGILRRSLKNKIQESISRKSLPIKRRTASTVLKKTPAPSSLLYDDGFDDGDTPRHILKNILQTEPVKTPVVHEHAESEDLQPQLPSANSSLQSSRPSIELSGLELPDLTIGNIASTVKGLSRKRPRRSFNVTAFEKRFKEGNDIVEDEESVGDHSSLSLSSTSLSLKTPFINVQTEKKGLQRRVSNRRKISEEEFRAAVNKNQHGESGLEQRLSETAYAEGFTLGLSKLSEPDITTDIVNCNTALYSKTDGIMSNFSTLATQDKPTVMASQLQRDMEEQLDAKNNETYFFPVEEKTLADSEDNNPFVLDGSQYGLGEPADEEAAVMSQSGQEKSVAKLQSSYTHDPVESVKEENGEQPQSEEADSQTEDNAAVSAYSEEEDAADIQTEKQDEIDAQSGDEVTAVSENEESAVGQRSDQDASEMSSRLEEEGNDSQMEGEKDGERKELDNMEYISRRARYSESGLIMPTTKIDEDLTDTTKAGHSNTECIASDLPSNMDVESGEVSGLLESSTHKDASDTEADTDVNKENSFHENDVMHENDPPEDVIEQEEQSEDDYEEEEEDDDIPSKTPAFVKEKRNFSLFYPQPSSLVLKNIQASDTSTGLPAAKPKQRIQRKPRSAKSEAGLPKSYLMTVFKHFAKTKVSADVYPVLKEIMDKFFDRVAKDLEAYALHARRSTIEVTDGELLLKRQGHVNDKVPVEVLIEKYLRMDQRRLLIPIATSGNGVIPKKR